MTITIPDSVSGLGNVTVAFGTSLTQGGAAANDFTQDITCYMMPGWTGPEANENTGRVGRFCTRQTFITRGVSSGLWRSCSTPTLRRASPEAAEAAETVTRSITCLRLALKGTWLLATALTLPWGWLRLTWRTFTRSSVGCRSNPRRRRTSLARWWSTRLCTWLGRVWSTFRWPSSPLCLPYRCCGAA